MCKKEEQEMTPQQHHKTVKDRRNIQGNIQNRCDGFFLLTQIFNLISLQERLGGTIECNKILALTLRYLATGESFQSLSF